MWITTKEFSFLQANQSLIKGSKVVMIGRQTNYMSEKKCNQLGAQKESYAENLFTFLWAKQVVSIDYSDYENPTYTHDFNTPLKQKELLGNFDIVFDGGSTEHMYNPVQAIINYKNLLKIWGYYLAVLPMNNQCNHGFYQFSPDFFYRTFAKEFWYKTKCFTYWRWWKYIKEVADAGISNYSLTFQWSSMIFVISQKLTTDTDPNTILPFQTIYHQFLRKNMQNKKWYIYHFITKLVPERVKEKISTFQTRKKMLVPVPQPSFTL